MRHKVTDQESATKTRACDPRSEEGIVVPMVVALATLVFVLVTMITLVAMNSTVLTRKSIGQTRAVHMADAGLNAYLYQLKRNPDYWLTNPTLGPVSQDDGIWSVSVSPPTQTSPLMIHASGSIPSQESTKSITARVRFPTFADYMFLADTDINIGSGATIQGKVRSNSNVTNSGRITGTCEAVGTITGSGTFEQAKTPGAPRVDFAQVTADLADIRTAATASNTFFGPSGVQGYRAVISGTSVTVSAVTGGTATGNLTLTPVRTFSIPASGVIYFSDRVWVSGKYSAKVTIASSSDIYIPLNLVPSNPTGTSTCGLIAAGSIIVPTWYPSIPVDMAVTAAMLAQSGAIYGDLRDGVITNKITITGSMAYRTYGYFAQYSGSTVTAGFRTRVYQYDQRLDLNPPPLYPQIKDGSLKVTIWNED